MTARLTAREKRSRAEGPRRCSEVSWGRGRSRQEPLPGQCSRKKRTAQAVLGHWQRGLPGQSTDLEADGGSPGLPAAGGATWSLPGVG